MIAAEICRAALCEAGRPDLARNIGTNRRGQPIRAWTAYYGTDAELVARAFRQAIAAGCVLWLELDGGELPWQLHITPPATGVPA